MDHLPFSLPPFDPGSVWLTGAGPGDPGLLTLMALHGLRHADIVIHDALLDSRLLALVRPGVTVEAWGKRGGRASPHQSAITARLIELAGQGLRVLRLKGGDPFVFGRGAEEALALAAAAIPFRIVPGITSGIGGLAYAGLPVTAGVSNSAFAFVTGHGPDGGLPDDLERVAQAPVLVVFMGLKHLADLSCRLVAAGRSPDEAAALVAEAATPRQRVVETRLADLAESAAAHALDPPALVVVGPIVALRAQLDWWRPHA
ncbi:uroporphyrinogen-III C-methyltransferase [Magnetospirillum molischianum]|uniref:uroporphyrinogen-III C-methyltransferase n=1 Tax=Magnetospirillum molischianum DSM 120 TaxID=1150626 RepID=H8FTL0_MAGML|nr:uroporphyrinogen-III C-methyltransferase [Magnetospirillum molischianum]CCG41698.1 Uroporphyrinogen-III C-methyltransferase [Magnetospirillum molischianum DSM 120]